MPSSEYNWVSSSFLTELQEKRTSIHYRNRYTIELGSGHGNLLISKD